MSIAVVSVYSESSAIFSAISMISVTGLAIGGSLATILLIFLLSSKEILSASSYWDKKISNFYDILILPLLIVFSLIVTFKIMQIV
jgi:hypothetical protein